VLSPATRTKLATLEKGQLMIRHPHFTQPIFVRFPRPAVMQGRDGAELFPQAADVTLEAALYRSLRELDRDIPMSWIQELVGLYDEEDLIRVRNAAMLAAPANVRTFFQSRLRALVPAESSPATERQAPARLRPQPIGDPYGS
jgi:hypothetical protein